MSGRPPFASRPPRNCNLTANYYTHRAGGCQDPAEGFFLRCAGRLPSLFTLRLPVALSVTVRLRVLCHLLLRLADFCGAPQRALAKTGALRRSQLPVSAAGSGRCSRPHRGRQEHARGCRLGGGKANLLTASPYHSFAGFDGGTLGSPCGGAGERSETERGVWATFPTKSRLIHTQRKQRNASFLGVSCFSLVSLVSLVS